MWATLALLLACDADKGTATADTGDSAAEETACGGELELSAGRVRTSVGVVQGVASGGTWAFLGLPFAQPPTGDLRFRAPEPVSCAEGVFDASAYAPLCAQRDETGDLVGEEDCLALNLWSPASLPETGDPRPVLFFVHGGGNVSGGTSQSVNGVDTFDGAVLAERMDAVVVTAAYRLGALGFLAHPDLSAEAGVSGNYGLRDQILALRWVQDEIAAFGGDPSRVLLFGESAGAVDTCALYTAPDAAGLFSAALMESGACTQPTLAEREDEGEDKVEEAGCAEAADVPACLRALDALDLAALSDDVISASGVPGQGGFGPNVDGTLLPLDPMEAIEAGADLDLPLVVGSNADETAAWVPDLTEEQYTTYVETLFGRLSGRVLALYPVENYDSPRWAWIDLTSDGVFTCPARRIARAAVASGTSPVWRTWFTRDPAGVSGAIYGAFHGLELVYVFQHLDAVAAATGYDPTDEDEAIEAAMGGAWVALADQGDPSLGVDVAWPGYDVESDPYLELGDHLGAAEGVHTEACDFWDEISALTE